MLRSLKHVIVTYALFKSKYADFFFVFVLAIIVLYSYVSMSFNDSLVWYILMKPVLDVWIKIVEVYGLRLGLGF